MTLTLSEQFAECQFRIAERIAILCEDREPTTEQMAIAEKEAQDWQRRYLAENPSNGQREMLL